MSLERVQKILARAGVAARRKAEEMVRQGRVTINGEVAHLGSKADPATDSIKLDGKRVQTAKGHRYLLLNKPRGYLTAVADEAGRPTVIQLVPQPMRKALIPVGRLDYQTEGLLLLTDDGEFAQRISHPRYGCHKTYEVKVKGTPEERQLVIDTCISTAAKRVPVLIGTGAEWTDECVRLSREAQSMGADKHRLFRHVILPGAMPYILTGLRLGLAQAWRILIAVEMLASVNFGLGWLIFGAREFLDTAAMMSGVVVIAVIGLLLEKYVFQKIEAYTVVRWGMVGSM